MKKITITLLCATVMISVASGAQRLEQLRAGGQQGGDLPQTPVREREQFDQRLQEARRLGPDTPTIIRTATSVVNGDEDIPDGLKAMYINSKVRTEKSGRDQQRREAVQLVEEERNQSRLERVEQHAVQQRIIYEAEDALLRQQVEARLAQADEGTQQLQERITVLEEQIRVSEQRENELRGDQVGHQANVERLERLLQAHNAAQLHSVAELERMETELAEERRLRDEAQSNLRAAEIEKARLRRAAEEAIASRQRLHQTVNGLGVGRAAAQGGAGVQGAQGGGNNAPVLPPVINHNGAQQNAVPIMPQQQVIGVPQGEPVLDVVNNPHVQPQAQAGGRRRGANLAGNGDDY